MSSLLLLLLLLLHHHHHCDSVKIPLKTRKT
jgi:hypothetical protein